MTDDSLSSPRQLAFTALREIGRRGAYTDFALDRALQGTELKPVDRGLVTELVCGIVRRRRSLDALLDQLGKKKAQQQPPDLRLILHIGLYQLRYLSQVPPAAAVHTTVELAKANRLKRLAGVVNGVLRQYLRLAGKSADPLQLPTDPVQRLGVLHSFPDWIVEIWRDRLGLAEAEKLCKWFNQSPSLDLRVNPLRSSVAEVETALREETPESDKSPILSRLPHLPQGLRLAGKTGPIRQLPGFQQGWWTVQDGSAQLVGHLLDPQPGEVIIDACAAPGGKTTHIAELMQDRGTIWACDRALKRLNKVKQNAGRLHLQSIQLCPGDSRSLTQFQQAGDRVLVDVPCSGLGTLHRHPDIRWRQTPQKAAELAQLQQEILTQAATWVKPGGILVYATCTLNPGENEAVVQSFLASHPGWQIQAPTSDPILAPFATSLGWIQILPTQHHLDGFFMVKLKQRLGID